MDYNEKDMIETICEINRNGHSIPENSLGVIVHVYKNQNAFEVEFPEGKIVTLTPDEIQENGG